MADCKDAETIASAIDRLVAVNQVIDSSIVGKWSDLVTATGQLQNTKIEIRVVYPIVVKYRVTRMDTSTKDTYQITKIGKSTGSAIGYPQCYFNVNAGNIGLASLASKIKAIDDTGRAVGAIACFPDCPSCTVTPLAQADTNGETLWNYNFNKDTCQELDNTDICSPRNKIFIPLSECILDEDTSFELESGQIPENMWVPNPVFFPKFSAIFIPRDFSLDTNPSSSAPCTVGDNDDLNSEDVSETGLTPEEREWHTISGGKYKYIMYSYLYTATFSLTGAIAFGCAKNNGHTPIREDILGAKTNITQYMLLESIDDLVDLSITPAINIVPPKFENVSSICSSLDMSGSLSYVVKDPVIYAGQFAKQISNNSGSFSSYIDSIESILKDENSHSVSVPGIALLQHGVLLSEASYETASETAFYGRVCEVECQDPDAAACSAACDCSLSQDPDKCGDIILPPACLLELLGIRNKYDKFSSLPIYGAQISYFRVFAGSWSIADYFEGSWDSSGGVLAISNLSSACEDTDFWAKFRDAPIGQFSCSDTLWDPSAVTIKSTLCELGDDDLSGNIYVSYDCDGKGPHCFQVAQSSIKNNVLLMSYSVPNPFTDTEPETCSNYFLVSEFSSSSMEESLYYPEPSSSFSPYIWGSVQAPYIGFSAFYACDTCDSGYGCCASNAAICQSHCTEDPTSDECRACVNTCYEQCIAYHAELETYSCSRSISVECSVQTQLPTDQYINCNSGFLPSTSLSAFQIGASCNT